MGLFFVVLPAAVLLIVSVSFDTACVVDMVEGVDSLLDAILLSSGNAVQRQTA